MVITYIFLYFVDNWSKTFWYRSRIYKELYPYWCNISAFFYHAGFINTIYNASFLKFISISYTHITKYLDKGFFEFFGPYGLYKGFRFMYFFCKFWWYSSLTIVILLMFVGLCFCLTLFIFWISQLYLLLFKYLGLFFIISFVNIIYVNE
jgi:hypothetical protein